MNKKRIFCIAIMVVMLFSTMGVGAFAAVDQGIDVQGNTQSEEVQGDTTEPETILDEEVVKEADIAVAEEPVYDYHPVSGVSTLSGHQRIKVSWPAFTAPKPRYEFVKGTEEPQVEDAYYEVTEKLVGYVIVRNDGKVFDEDRLFYEDTEDRLFYEDTAVGDGIYMYNGSLHGGQNFAYRVIAKTELKVEKKTDLTDEQKASATEVEVAGQAKMDQGTAIGNAPQTGYANCVRTSAVKLKLKTKKKLTSHDNKRVTRTFAKGTTLYTCGFGVGKHMFIYGDNMYYLNRISTKSTSSITTKTAYDWDTAKYFVDSRGNSSKTGYLIWVSVYTQHLYIFKGSARNWQPVACYSVSTGKSKTPTIRTIDPQGNPASGKMIGTYKTISKKLKKRHGIPYWNCFSSYNAIHGKKSKWKINSVPQSGGCVRNTNDHAQWIYNNCPMGTTVILF